MTTNDTAAAWRISRRFTGAAWRAALVATAAFGIAGCSTNGGDLLGSNQPPSPQVAAPQPPAAEAPKTRVTIAPVIGAPDALAKQLVTQVSEAAQRQRVHVARDANDKTDYTVRGYVVAARDTAGTKVSYIWDVTDLAGRRVHRITGEEMAPAAPGRDPWSTVTPNVIQAIADKTAAQLGAWTPSQAPAVAASPASPSGVGAQPAAVGGAPQPAAQPAVARDQPAAQPATAQPSAAAGGDVITHVSSITGAPGDGSSSLAGAIQRELSRNGVAISDRAAPGAYKVEAKVVLGKAASGKQPIQIDWLVRDPKGNRLGTVSQKNEIDAGSLDVNWGKTADLAAAAAAQGIIKLLPQKATN